MKLAQLQGSEKQVKWAFSIRQAQFDRTWISGAIEEPLDELDIRASTRLE